MNAPSPRLRVLLAAVALCAALIAAPVAEAAKVRIGGKSVRVGENRVAGIGLGNPNGSRMRGTLTLRHNGARVGRKRFSIPAGSRRKVRVRIGRGAYATLRRDRAMVVKAAAKARRKGTARRQIVLTAAAAPAPPTGGTPPGGGGSGSAWTDGRYQGTYAENNADLSFNVVGTRLFTGPFDSFYLEATCRNVDPGYTGPDQVYTNATAYEPVEATIAGDGRFSGSGVYNTGVTSQSWTISGRIAGGTVTEGQFSASYTDTYGNPCSGTTNFTAGWYGDYTL